MASLTTSQEWMRPAKWLHMVWTWSRNALIAASPSGTSPNQVGTWPCQTSAWPRNLKSYFDAQAWTASARERSVEVGVGDTPRHCISKAETTRRHSRANTAAYVGSFIKEVP